MNPIRYLRQLRSGRPSNPAARAAPGSAEQSAFIHDIEALEDILNCLFDVVWAKDDQGRFIYINDTLVGKVGIPRESVIGFTANELAINWPDTILGANTQSIPMFDAEDQKVLSGRGEHDSVDELDRPDQSPIWLHRRKVPYVNRDGRIVGLIGFSRNVTLEKQAAMERESKSESLQAKLRETELMAKGAAQLVQLGWCRWRHDEDRYSYVDEVYAQIYGYTPEEFISRFTELEADLGLLHPDDVEPVVTYYETNDYTKPSSHEYRVINRFGDLKYLREMTSPIEVRDGRCIESLSTVQDVTELKVTEQRLMAQSSQARKSRALSEVIFRNLTHELRTPLSGILGCLANAEVSALSDANLKLHMRMQGEARQMSDLAEDLLHLTRSQSGEDENPVSERASIPEMVYEVIAHAVGDAEKAGLTLRVELEIDDDVRHNSGAEIRTALRKYLENAFNFSGGGEVVVAVSRIEAMGEPAQLKFCVTDQGIGIGAEDQKRVFDAYFKADGALKGGRGGAGMGLTVVKLLVQSMGGDVGVESAPGEGSQFWFTVPQS